jgi:hypothetical protein
VTTIAGVKMADMKRSKESLSPSNVGKISPDPYSYEHRISLDQDALAKLGMTETPKVGDVFHVMGEGHVHSVNTDGSGSTQVGVQMRKLGMKPKQKGGGKGGAFDAVSQGVKDAGE